MGFLNLWFPILTSACMIVFLSLEASAIQVPTPLSGDDALISVRRTLASVSSDLGGNVTFVLAANQTRRSDPLNNFHPYTGGWNISNKHYWASVAYTAAPIFVAAAAWFILCGLLLLFSCCCYCCYTKPSSSYSRGLYCISFFLLAIFTAGAIIGCILLYSGQDQFHGGTSGTVNYVVSQADNAVLNMNNFSDLMASAKNSSMSQLPFSASVLSTISDVTSKVEASANELSSHVADNSKKIRNVLDTVSVFLTVAAALLLVLALLGFLSSLCRQQCLVLVFVFTTWIIVTGAFILCGTFFVLNNAISDTCVAMNEWAVHPEHHTALDDILPCVDPMTANEALVQSRNITYQIVSRVDWVITNVFNGNFTPQMKPMYYNQSGQLMPLLCNPYAADLSNVTCGTEEVGFDNAMQVWKDYVCVTTNVSGLEICSTVGRLTPSYYAELKGPTVVSSALYKFAPILINLEDCSFVRETFQSIISNRCPGLNQYSHNIYLGLLVASTALALCVILWIVFSREGQRRKESKQFVIVPEGLPLPGPLPAYEEKPLLKRARTPY